MKNRHVGLILLSLATGCSSEKPAEMAEPVLGQGSQSAPQNKFGFAEAIAPGPDLFGSNAPTARMMAYRVNADMGAASELSVETPNGPAQTQIAYSYGFGFRIVSSKIADLQKAHTAICDAMGPKCRVLHTSLSTTDQDGSGEVKLQVAATEAGAFEKALTEPALKLGGELVSSVRDGEDLSKNIIDSEAKLRSRLVLREKLTDILRNNRGSVDELIKAEKAVADVNEEIDATASELQGFRSRIRFSDVSIDYQTTYGETQLGFGRPILTAARSIGTTLGITIAVLIYVITALVPVVLFVLALRWVLHRFGLRIRFWRKRPKILEDVT